MIDRELQGEDSRRQAAACRSQLLDRIAGAISKLTNPTFARCDGSEDRMLQLHLHSPHALLTSDRLVADLRDLWKNEFGDSEKALIRFVDTISGFEFRFALQDDCGEIVTGQICVDLAPGVA